MFKKNKWVNFGVDSAGCEIATPKLMENLEKDFQRYLQYHREAISPVTQLLVCDVLNSIEKLQISLKDDIKISEGLSK